MIATNSKAYALGKLSTIRTTIQLGWSGRRSAHSPFFLVAAAWLIATAALLPVGYLMIRAAGVGAKVWDILLQPRTLEVFVGSAGLAFSVTLVSMVIGVLLAWLTVRTDLPGRTFWAVVTSLPLVLPSYVGAFTLVAALGPKGMVQSWLEPLGIDRLPSIYGFPGALLALTLFTYPYVLLSVRAALRGLDPSLEEAARSLGRSPLRVFWEITLPHLRPSIFAGGLLVALYTLSDFGAVSLLRFNSFTRAIYLQYSASLDRSAAAVLALLLVGLTMLILWIEARMRGKARYYRSSAGALRPPTLVKLGPWQPLALAFCVFITLLGIAMPLLVMGFWLVRGLMVGEELNLGLEIVFNSVSTSGLAALAAILAAIPVAVLAVHFPGQRSRWLERSTYVGYALPGIVIALSLVFFGANYATFLYQTLAMLVFAYVVRFLPQAIGTTRASLLQISPRLEEAARSLGRTSGQTLASVTVPLLKPGLLTGLALVFLTGMKELPATLLLGPTGFQTLATRIWSATEQVFFARAAAPALLLVLVSAISIWIILAQEEKGLRR
ncbi:MAG: iron ABC transporter permease [Anaerolineae bacterium]|nr:iron ABC transporter permease [Anaerolineae bacterium]